MAELLYSSRTWKNITNDWNYYQKDNVENCHGNYVRLWTEPWLAPNLTLCKLIQGALQKTDQAVMVSSTIQYGSWPLSSTFSLPEEIKTHSEPLVSPFH